MVAVVVYYTPTQSLTCHTVLPEKRLSISSFTLWDLAPVPPESDWLMQHTTCR